MIEEMEVMVEARAE